MASFEFGDHTPIGVFYQNEHIPTYEERLAQRIQGYKDNPPGREEIARKDGTPAAAVSKLLEDFRVT
jgi:2-oxoglutarate ferredoxin oxidoreductase subunit beta